jgi:hypothetical protein
VFGKGGADGQEHGPPQLDQDRELKYRIRDQLPDVDTKIRVLRELGYDERKQIEEDAPHQVCAEYGSFAKQLRPQAKYHDAYLCRKANEPENRVRTQGILPL